jgi:hypothetical protein
MKLKQIKCHLGKSPIERASHGMTAITKKYFLIYGGLSFLQIKGEGKC